MGRQLNIRSDEAYEIAHDVANRTGRPVSEVVVAALRQYGAKTGAFDDLTPAQKANVEAIRDAAHRAAAHMKPGVTYEQVMDEMYDENGSPR